MRMAGTEGQTDKGEAELRAAIELLPVPTLVVDTSGLVAAVNRAWPELTGQDRRAALGLGWLGAVSSGGRARVMDLLRSVIAASCSGEVDAHLGIWGQTVPARWYMRPCSGYFGASATVSVVTTANVEKDSGADTSWREVADLVVRELLAVELSLETCAGRLESAEAERVRAAAVQLDEVINTLRHAPFRPRLTGAEARRAAREGIDQLIAEARMILKVFEARSEERASEIHVFDSLQCLHRAIIGLAEAATGR
jgi:PAS domain S-box-containing protein